jgi:hypothetical protein
MLYNSDRNNAICLSVIILLVISVPLLAEEIIIDLEFVRPAASDSDTARTLQSLVKVQGTGQFCEDGLYLMTHFGDREEIFLRENQEMIDNPLIDQTWRHCSVFSRANDNSAIMGRNWDNQNVGSIIVSLYHPPGGYSSISFCRSIDLGFGHKDLEGITSSIFGDKLLLAPFYAMDGINEHGLAVAVAGVKQTTHTLKPDKQLVFVPFLVRKILDRAKNVEEAVSLVERYTPFDIDRNSLSTHFIIVDSSGRSVILEYDQDQWRRVYGDGSWQALTNKPVYDVPDADLREKCWRYRSIAETLENAEGAVDWRAGMKILQDVTQKGTTWSVIYSLTTRELYFSVYQNGETIYHLKTP